MADFMGRADTGRVSIRSPHRSEGRSVRDSVARRQRGFQSAPLTEARGDRGLQILKFTVYGFNPLPSPKRGEMSSARRSRHRFNRFNPLPSPKRGEIPPRRLTRGDGLVSIRSPHRSEGRSRPKSRKFAPATFQSAPLTEARGDAHADCNAARNIRFQSAPLTEARGDLVIAVAFHLLVGFNPLPSPKRGEISQWSSST